MGTRDEMICDVFALAFGRRGRTGESFGESGELSDVEVSWEFISCLTLFQNLRSIDT